ncbi:MAG: TerB family tellurite resistance protein [Anaerolineae bacterium]|nr:TerB family tellurite resistance protein [Anaerolineae bacterium]
MTDANLMMTLGKVMIAIGWADGQLTPEEINQLKDVLFLLPNLTALQWAELDMYMEAPVHDAERARLVNELQQRVHTQADRQLVLHALDQLIAADGAVSPEEQAAVQKVRRVVEAAEVGLVGALNRFMDVLTDRRQQALSQAPNREQFFDDYVKNRVYYEISRRQREEQNLTLNIPDEKLRKLGMAGALMARVARIEGGINTAEQAVMSDALQTHWHIAPEEAELVAQVATEADDLDYFRTAREFQKSCTYEECVSFMDVLFAIATADHMATDMEIETIRKLSVLLKVSHRDFLAAKNRVPQDQQENGEN